MVQLKNIIKFREDLFFEGAVQADWFYLKEKADKVTESFVFHGPRYFSVSNRDIDSKKLIDTVSLTKKIYDNLYSSESINPFMLGIAGYGTGKSHLSVALAKLFSNATVDEKTNIKLISNLKLADEEIAEKVKLGKDKNLVLVLNGMKDFNLNYEILRAMKLSLNFHGVSDEFLKTLSQSYLTARNFIIRNFDKSKKEFKEIAEKYGKNTADLKNYLLTNLETEEKVFEIINEVYTLMVGHEIRWDEGISAGKILEVAEEYLCRKEGIFKKILIIFDEFGRYLEYASTYPQRAGDSALQQIFEAVQNKEGNIVFLGFIQSDIKTYLTRIDKTSNISRYIGRYDVSEKFYLSSNLETIFANLIEKKDKNIFKHYIEENIDNNKVYYTKMHSNMLQWIPLMEQKEIWRQYESFKKIILEGVYPLHPLSTYLLSSLSEWLQNRSSLTLLNKKIKEFGDLEVKELEQLKYIYPTNLLEGDLFEEILSAEQEGRQRSSYAIQYNNILKKFRDKLDKNQLETLAANLIIKISKIKNNSRRDLLESISTLSGTSILSIEQSLEILEEEYGILQYDERNKSFDFIEDSVGAGDFRRFLQKQKNITEFSIDIFKDIHIQELLEFSNNLSTGFGLEKSIISNEWDFSQNLLLLDEVKDTDFKNISKNIKETTGVSSPRAQLIWLYLNKDSDQEKLEKVQLYLENFKELPIEVFLLNDDQNFFKEALHTFITIKNINKNSEYQKRYSKYLEEAHEKNLELIKDMLNEMKLKRERLTSMGKEKIDIRLSFFLRGILNKKYPKIISFPFDGFSNKQLAAPKKWFVEISRLILSNKNYADIRGRSPEVKGRFEAVLRNSWKILDNHLNITFPGEEGVKNIYLKIDQKLENKKLNIKELYMELTSSPYGLNDYSFVLMLFTYLGNKSDEILLSGEKLKEKYSVSNWQDKVLGDKDIILKEILETIIEIVDIKDISLKFENLCNKIKANTDLSLVKNYREQLKKFLRTTSLPEEKLYLYNYAEEHLAYGEKLVIKYFESIREIKVKLDEAIEQKNVSEILKVYNKIEDFDPEETYGYIYPKNDVNIQRERALDAIGKYVDKWLEKVNCIEVGKMDSFERINKQISKQLYKLGFSSASNKLVSRIEKIMSNRLQIRAIEEAITNINQFLKDSTFSSDTSYVDLKVATKRIKELLKNLNENEDVPSNIKNDFVDKLTLKNSEIKKYIDIVDEKISEVYDTIEELKDLEEARRILDLIPALIGKGLDIDQGQELRELGSFINKILEEIKELEKIQNIKKLEYKYLEFKEKCYNEDLNIDMTEVVKKKYKNILDSLEKKEEEWINQFINFNPKDETNYELEKWIKLSINYPEYLSEKTFKKIEKLREEVNNILSENKLNYLWIQFSKLSIEEQSKFIDMIKK